ncbi:MAG: polyisoprenoid-binding protein [Rhodanobacteraceae bacterium]|jgi:polyisoprenoid-binding protein YceI|nr:polyisoprenoid-binding protein [Rhodanobacteraceae bacterium]
MLRRLALAAALTLVAAPAFAATYTLDPGHTQVVFSWNHFGYSNPTAQFRTIEGTLDYDQAAPTKATVKVTIPLASINSNVSKLDEHLQSADFFDVAQYPDATFASTKVEKGAGPNKLKVTGDLTLHGVTKPVVLDVTVNKVADHPMWKAPVAGFDASVTVKRSDFGISKYVPMVSDDIKIHITTEGIEAKAFAEATKAKS